MTEFYPGNKQTHKKYIEDFLIFHEVFPFLKVCGLMRTEQGVWSVSSPDAAPCRSGCRSGGRLGMGCVGRQAVFLKCPVNL